MGSCRHIDRPKRPCPFCGAGGPPAAFREGVFVQHADAPASSARTGQVTRLLRPMVGAPYMVRVQWSREHSAPVNARALRVVTLVDWCDECESTPRGQRWLCRNILNHAVRQQADTAA